MKLEDFATVQRFEERLRRHDVYGARTVRMLSLAIVLHCIFTLLL